MKPNASVSVLVEDDAIETISDLAQRLRSSGMTVQRILPGAGVITGLIPPDRIQAARKLQGVSAIEQQQDVRIAPPESDLQ